MDCEIEFNLLSYFSKINIIKINPVFITIIIEYNPVFNTKMLSNNFSVEDVKTPDGTSYKLMNLPYYLATKIPQYIEWFVTNYK